MVKDVFDWERLACHTVWQPHENKDKGGDGIKIKLEG